MIASHSHRFHSGTAKRTVLTGTVSGPHGNFGTGERTFKLHISNDGDKDVVVSIEGSEADAGYGLSWTSRANVTCKARAQALLSGAIRGQEVHWRLAVVSSGGDTSGRIEVIDASDNLIR